MTTTSGWLGVLLAATPLCGQGGGAVLYENGSPDMGLSYAGAGARAQDAATAFQNPAGMTKIEDNSLILGMMGVFVDLELNLDNGADGGGRQNQFSPGIGSFMVVELADDWAAGFSVTALTANGVDYDPNWEGRAFITKSFFVIANLEPALAYQVVDWLSVGAGLNLVYGKLDQDLKANNDPSAPTIQFDDADDWAVGGTFGLLVEPAEGTRVGLTYRTEIELELDGRVQSPSPINFDFGTDFTLPQGVNLSLYQQVSERWAVLADVGWSDWSAFDSQPISVGPIGANIDRDWDDTYRAAIGTEFRPTETWVLRTGFGFDSAAADSDNMLPDIPSGDTYRFSVGMQKDLGQGKKIGLSYTLAYQDIDVRNVTLPPSGTVTLNGDYDVLIHFVGLSLDLTF